MKKKLIFILIFSSISFLYADFPKVGKKAPKIEIAHWVTGRIAGKNPFAGKTVVLEFWATWCAPCVAAIPHLNELSEKFASPQVVFVSITDEQRNTVDDFLKKHKMKSFVVVDKDSKTYDDYGVTGIPHTFLIDAKGILRWHGYPTDLTEQFLSQFLKSGVVPEVVEPTKPIFLSENILRGKADSNNVFLFSISTALPGDSASRWTGSSTGRDLVDFQYHGFSVRAMLSSILQIPLARIQSSATLSQQLYDVRLRIKKPMPIDSMREEAGQIICRAAGLQMERVKDSIKVWMLSIENPSKLKKSAATSVGHTSSANDVWIATAIPFNVLPKSLENLYDVLVDCHDSTSVQCDFELPADDFEKARTILLDNYGVSMKEQVQQAQVMRLKSLAGNR